MMGTPTYMSAWSARWLSTSIRRPDELQREQEASQVSRAVVSLDVDRPKIQGERGFVLENIAGEKTMCSLVTLSVKRCTASLLMLALVSPVGASDNVQPQVQADRLERRIERITNQLDQLHTRLEDAVTRIEDLGIVTRPSTVLQQHQATTSPATTIEPPVPAKPEPRSWIVAITNNPDPAVAHLFERLEEYRDRLPEVTARLITAREKYQELRADNTTDLSVIAETRREMIELGYDQREIKALVRRTTLDIDQARARRTVEGLTSDGTVVRIQASGSMSDLAGTLMEGATYSITGTGESEDGLVEISMTSAEISNLNIPVANATNE